MASAGDAQSPNSSPPTLPWNRKLADLFTSFLFRRAFRSDFTVNRRLLGLLDRKVPPFTTRGVAASDMNIDSSSSDHLWIRVYNPLTFFNSDPLPVIVFFHGGGFVYGSADSPPIDTFCRDFAREIGAIVISVNYRLAPEHRFPSQFDDGFHVLKAMEEGVISETLPENADLRRCFIAGESAGGNIAHHVTVRAAEGELKRLKIVGMILIQPFLGGEERRDSEIRFGRGYGMTVEMADWFWKAWLPVGSNRDHPAANVVRSSISGVKLPPAVVVIGGLDLLRDRQKEYVEWLKKWGEEVRVVEYPNGTHGFIWKPDLPEYSMLMQDAPKQFANNFS
ncbi:putative carboxylesterase 18 [Cucumis melo var. makuwa]|uniref:Carboxylesterase 18 n=2 Tax=Cucumis melo TaxID=3656 RepID=A0A5A7T4I6_CUCMM|nr:probable carboxylesterase 18 [Cucumis melo]KAA0037036.1 putative carboxylesterase 18 [Cucumis melo var. makuwa]TYK06614.1 putative carboxylesterase 18 [Cucumis melo var. makuwa]